MLNALTSGLLTGAAIAIPLGAVGMLVLLQSAHRGLRAGVAAGLGVASVDGAYALAAAFGASSLAPRVEAIADELRITTTVVLVLIALSIVLRAFRTPMPGATVRGSTSAWRGFVAFVGLTAINPLTLVYFASVAMGSAELVRGTSRGITFAASAFLGSGVGQLIWVMCGWILRPTVVGRRGRILTACLGAAVITAVALKKGLG